MKKYKKSYFIYSYRLVFGFVTFLLSIQFLKRICSYTVDFLYLKLTRET